MERAVAGAGTVRDPVCGMTVAAGAARPTVEHGGRTWSFCSAGCAARFREDPARWIVPAARPEAPAAADAEV